MKRTTLFSAVLACGFITTGVQVFAQSQPAVTIAERDWFAGKATVQMLGRDNVDSSKYEEYRAVPKGMSIPVFTLQGSQNGKDFALFGQNISLSDQRYNGYANSGALGVSFDYNQIPHHMGNNGRSIMTELAPGYWGMNATLRQALGSVVNAQLPTATRDYPFFAALYAPTIAAANTVDLDGLRQRGSVEVNMGRNLPFDLRIMYTRDVKSGTRGAGGGTVRAFSDNIVEVPQSLNELTQDVGFRAAINRTWGNVHAAFNRNWYNDRQETLVIDNPLQPFDQVYRAAAGTVPATGGTSRALFVNPPDNSANTGSFGAQFKLARQTRIAADVAIGRWTQNAQLYPYTIFSLGTKADGTIANTASALQFQSLDGKIDTTTLNFSFSSRPVEGLGLRARYRSYDLDNKTPATVREGSFGRSPDRVWAPAIYGPLGYPTASPYGSKHGRFDLQASYDINDLTLEAAYRNSKIERTYREATKGAESGASVAAILRTSDVLHFRGVFDRSKRTASGYDTSTTLGLQADESERDSTRAGLDVELTPNDKVGFVLAYLRRNDDYPNRPNRVTGVNNTSNGLLNAKYETYTAEVDLTPGERAELMGYYTYEKNLSTTRYGSSVVTNILTFDGSDKTNTFGVNGNFVLVTESYASGVGRWTFNLNARRQKLDGLMAITGDPTGSFALARAAYGGIQNINDYDDTELMTLTAELDTVVAESWDLAFGYAYEKYDFADSASEGTEVYPVSGAFYLKANNGPYTVNVGYVKLNYRF